MESLRRGVETCAAGGAIAFKSEEGGNQFHKGRFRGGWRALRDAGDPFDIFCKNEQC